MDLKRLFMFIGVLLLVFGLVACQGAAEEEDPFAEPGVEEPLGEEDPLLEEEPLGEEPLGEEGALEGEEPLAGEEDQPLAGEEVDEGVAGEEEEPLAGEGQEPMAGEETPFAEFDEDDDALLSEEEFTSFLSGNDIGFDEGDATRFTEFDENQDQFLSEDEFNTFTAAGPGPAEGVAGEEGEDVAGNANDDVAGNANEDVAGNANEDVAGNANEDMAGEDVDEDVVGEEAVPGEAAAAAPVMLSNELIGMEVTSNFSDVTAEVEEVLIDQQGMIHLVILDAAGFLGLDEEQTVALDWDLFQVNQQGAAMAEMSATQPVIVFMGTEDDLAAAQQIDIAILDEADLVVDAATLELASEFDGLIQVSEFADWDLLQDWELVNAEGEELGVPDQLIVNLPQGQASYMIADVGGFLGIEENKIAIPWRLVQVDLVEEAFIVPVDQTALENAPVFDQAMFEDDTMLAEDWDSEIATYWEGIEPIEAAELEE